jgi:hypothetical protein
LSKDINHKRSGLKGNDKNSILSGALMEELELENFGDVLD